MVVRLFMLPRGQAVKIFLEGDPQVSHIEFDHIDGMYSYCVAIGHDGKRLGVCHLAAYTPLEEVAGGYRITEEPRDVAL